MILKKKNNRNVFLRTIFRGDFFMAMLSLRKLEGKSKKMKVEKKNGRKEKKI